MEVNEKRVERAVGQPIDTHVNLVGWKPNANDNSFSYGYDDLLLQAA